ncbi:MAG TPA: hypothetical protein VF832_03445 [Longimicrobiales bacterium]
MPGAEAWSDRIVETFADFDLVLTLGHTARSLGLRPPTPPAGR